MGDQSKQDETDLLFILKSFKNGILNLFHSIGRLIDFSIKNIWLLLVFALVGIGAGIGLHTIKKPTYSYSMCLSHVRLDNDNCELLVNGLADLINPESNSVLAKKLNVSIDIANSIKDVEYKTLNERVEKLYSDSTHTMLPFQVKIKVKDSGVIDSLQKGILYYLESTDYATKLKAIEKISLDDLELKIKNNLVQLDSLKHTVDNSIAPRATGNGIILGEPVDPVLVYKIDLEMYKQLVKIREKQALNNSFDVMMGFIPNPSESSKGVVFYAFFGMLISYIFGLIYISRKQRTHQAD